MISILRLGHRPSRDKRMTTHVGLVARAFGADRMYVSAPDKALEENIKEVSEKFGGSFEAETGIKWRTLLKNFEGIVVHLTMYGEPLDEIMGEIGERMGKGKDLLVVVGSEKVPREVYDEADFNVAVGNQPHSEVAALAIFLDRLFKGRQFEKSFDGKIKIIPSKRGKKVVSKDYIEE